MRKKELILKISAWATGLLALTQCASVQEMEIPVPAEGSFEIFATPEDTRTVNEGQSTRWVKGDRFNLFHAVAGATSYVADGAFTVKIHGTAGDETLRIAVSGGIPSAMEYDGEPDAELDRLRAVSFFFGVYSPERDMMSAAVRSWLPLPVTLYSADSV